MKKLLLLFFVSTISFYTIASNSLRVGDPRNSWYTKDKNGNEISKGIYVVKIITKKTTMNLKIQKL